MVELVALELKRNVGNCFFFLGKIVNFLENANLQENYEFSGEM